MKPLLLALLLAAPAHAQSTCEMAYTITPDTINHYLNVTLRCTPPPHHASTTLRMPVWAPGYYLIVDFPKYLTDFAATDTLGQPLPWDKVQKDGWTIHSAGQPFQANYRIYANQTSVAESHVWTGGAFVALNGVCMHPEGNTNLPVTVTYNVPNDWTITTALQPTANHTYHAPNFDVLYDSPALLGHHYTHRFTIDQRPFDYAIQLPQGTSNTLLHNFPNSQLCHDFQTMVRTATTLMQHTPYDNYAVIHLDGGQGGLEHANSQACYVGNIYRNTDNLNNRQAYIQELAFFTHEFFHLYNVKHIRPIELGPFDYSRENYTPMLWVSEGFTVYYEGIILARAGIIDAEAMRQKISQHIQNIESNQGHRHMSLRQSSYDIWLNFFNHADNGKDVRISYYEKGPIIALLFDITIRDLTNNKRSLDDLMRTLYQRYDQQLKRGFTEDEFWLTAQEIAGDSLTQLKAYVNTTDEINYDDMLARAALQLQRPSLTLTPLNKATSKAKAIGKAIGMR